MANGIGLDHVERAVRKPRSKATFPLEPLGPQVRLTVVQVRNGRPALLSSLTTLLETDAPLAPVS